MPFSGKTIALLTLLGPAAGCTVIDGDAMGEMVDRSMITNSIAPAPSALSSSATSPEEVSDGRTIRNAVSAANLSTIPETPLAWTNADTGASGQITAIAEIREGDAICRTFTTSRQRFDGVSLFAGEACTAGAGEWVLTRLNEGG